MKAFDINLIKKYDKQGPRYTSYPPAPFFTKDFTSEDFKRCVIESNAKESEISLYIHIPFCASLCYFCGCNMIISHDFKQMEKYVNLMKKEIEMVIELMGSKRKIGQLHFGGGSPSFLPSTLLFNFMNFLKSKFDFSEDSEVAIEIDPRDYTPSDVAFLSEIGFNRISMGIQDFNPLVQKTINRIQTFETTSSILDSARQNNFKSINVDLIYGLPYQTAETFSSTVDAVIKLSPDRIALYNFAYLPNLKKHLKLLKQETLPSPEEKLKILDMAVEKFTGAGYEYIGMDHFAKPSDELTKAQKNKTLHRNFQGYSTKAGLDLFAFGVSSISFVNDTYKQNTKSLQDYEKAIRENVFPVILGYKLDEDDKIRKYVITHLMCHMYISKSEFFEKFGIPFDEYFKNELPMLNDFIEDNLLSNESKEIKVSEMGRFVIRNIAMCFDKYSQQERYKKTSFSRTI